MGLQLFKWRANPEADDGADAQMMDLDARLIARWLLQSNDGYLNTK